MEGGGNRKVIIDREGLCSAVHLVTSKSMPGVFCSLAILIYFALLTLIWEEQESGMKKTARYKIQKTLLCALTSQ